MNDNSVYKAFLVGHQGSGVMLEYMSKGYSFIYSVMSEILLNKH